jgi:hypothetical protein
MSIFYEKVSFYFIFVGFLVFLLNDCSKKETHDVHSNVNSAVPAGSGAVVIFNDKDLLDMYVSA